MHQSKRKSRAYCTVDSTSMLTRKLFTNYIYPLYGPTVEYAAPVWDPKRLGFTWKRAEVCMWNETRKKATMSFWIWQTRPLLQTEGCTLNCVPCTKLCTTSHSPPNIWSHQIVYKHAFLNHLVPAVCTLFSKLFCPSFCITLELTSKASCFNSLPCNF